MRLQISALVLCAMLCTALVAQGPANPMRPGRWEITMEMQVPNAPAQMPPMKTTQCITAEQLKDPTSALPSGVPAGTGPSCKATDYKVSNNTVSFTVTCGPPQNMTASGEMTFDGDSYAGTMKMTTQQGDMFSTLAGKRLGDCAP